MVFQDVEFCHSLTNPSPLFEILEGRCYLQGKIYKIKYHNKNIFTYSLQPTVPINYKWFSYYVLLLGGIRDKFSPNYISCWAAPGMINWYMFVQESRRGQICRTHETRKNWKTKMFLIKVASLFGRLSFHAQWGLSSERHSLVKPAKTIARFTTISWLRGCQ